MKRSIRGLVTSWIVYWVGLTLVTLGPAMLAMWRATRAPDGSSSISLNFGDGAFKLTVVDQGVTTFAGSASLIAIAAWVAGPPLLSWIVWAMRTKRSEREKARAEL